MPNRIIKESVKRSPEIDRLSWFEEVVFYRMIVTADDFGRLDGRPVVLKNDLFPTKETVTKKAIEDAVAKLASVGLLIPYVDQVSGMSYIQIRTWDKHQTVRNKYSRYPAPPEHLLTDCKQLQTDCKQLSANCSPESESESISESESESRGSARARTRFTPPDLADVISYAGEMGWPLDTFDPQRFVDFYASKGWKVGSASMKDWRAAARGWVARDRGEGKAKPQQVNAALDYDQRATDASYYAHVFDEFEQGWKGA